MKKIKLLQLVEDLKIGGLEKVVANVSEGLNKEKYTTSVWCVARGGEVADELIKKGIDVKILGIRSYHNLWNIFKLTVLLKKAKPDIIHTHGYFASTIGRISAKIAGVPIIVTHVHTTFHNSMKLKNVIIEKFLNSFTNKIICVSQGVIDSFIKAENIKEGKAIVIYNGVIGELYKPFSNKKNKIIGTIASLYPHKGQRYLLRAMKIVLDEIPRAQLWIIGDGPLKDDLKKESMDLGIANQISFLGKRKDVPELLSQLNLFVLPSIREGLSISIMEAMASGLPVIATSVGGIPELVVDNETGILIPPKDEKALAEAIIKLLKNPNQMYEMGRKGLKIFEEKFTNKIMINKLSNTYEELIKHYGIK